MLKISKENLNGLYRKLSAAMPLYMPLKKAGEVNYGLWTEGAESSVETLKTVKSPKDLFLSMFILRANGRRGLGVAFRIIGERRLSFGSFTRLKIPVQSVDVFNKLSVQEM